MEDIRARIDEQQASEVRTRREIPQGAGVL
jgi:hypothetical protein